MGLKLSSCIHPSGASRQVHLPASPAPATVIATDGSLKKLPASNGVSVSDVLDNDTEAPFFVCDSDALYFNERPPGLASSELLRPGQIYFVLPSAMLDRPLSTADMAALAARASAALASSSSKPRRRRQQRRHGGGGKKVRVVPVAGSGEDVFFNEILNEQTLGELGALLSPAKSGGKLAAAAAARSWLKRALSIIQEDAE